MSNLLRYSSRLDMSAWTKHGIDIASFGALGSPTGRASRFTASTPVAVYGQRVSQKVDPIFRKPSTPYGLAIWLMTETYGANNVLLKIGDDDGSGLMVQFNIDTEATGSIATVMPVGGAPWSDPVCGFDNEGLEDGWKKFYLLGMTPGATIESGLNVIIQSANAAAPVGVSFLIAGAALLEGSGIPDFTETAGRVEQVQTLEVFEFPLHTVGVEYPDNATRVQFGRNWTFTSRPQSLVPQRIFNLSFETMQYHVTSAGVRDIATNPLFNAGRLEEFYQRHQTYQRFWYDHPYWGRIRVRFAKPLTLPEGVPGGNATLPPFQITLIEDPNSTNAAAVGGPQLSVERPALLLEDGNEILTSG